MIHHKYLLHPIINIPVILTLQNTNLTLFQWLTAVWSMTTWWSSTRWWTSPRCVWWVTSGDRRWTWSWSWRVSCSMLEENTAMMEPVDTVHQDHHRPGQRLGDSGAVPAVQHQVRHGHQDPRDHHHPARAPDHEQAAGQLGAAAAAATVAAVVSTVPCPPAPAPAPAWVPSQCQSQVWWVVEWRPVEQWPTSPSCLTSSQCHLPLTPPLPHLLPPPPTPLLHLSPVLHLPTCHLLHLLHLSPLNTVYKQFSLFQPMR